MRHVKHDNNNKKEETPHENILDIHKYMCVTFFKCCLPLWIDAEFGTDVVIVANLSMETFF